MLFEVFSHNSEGKLVSFIDYRESSAYDLTREQIADSITIVRKHRYESKNKFYGVIRQGEKAFMIPEWTEIHPEATYEDVYYKEPKKKVDRKKLGKWEFKSSSSDST